MNIKQKKSALVKEMGALEDAVKSGNADAIKRVDELAVEIDKINEKIKAADAASAKMNSFAKGGTSTLANVKTIGDTLVDYIKENNIARGSKASFVTPEVKASSDTVVSPTRTEGTLTDRVVMPYQRPLRIRDLFSNSQTDSPAVTYYAVTATGSDGSPAATAEGGQKPQFNVGSELKTVTLKKIAGVMKESDEILEDYPRLASAINGRGQYLLGLATENDLMSGDGTSNKITGVLSTTGIQAATYAKGATASAKADAIYAAICSVMNESGFDADGIVINPKDMQELRLAKDTNGQYLGGGYLTGAYGNGDYKAQDSIWGVPAVVTAAIPAGTILVGNFKAGGEVLSKGGVRVDTGYDGTDFSNNRVTFRVEERLGLAIYVPKAFVKITEAEK